MRIDLHCHTRFPGDGAIDPEELIRRALGAGLDGLAVTEHGSYAAGEAVWRAGLKLGFPVFRGVKIATDRGHFLVFGVEGDGWNRWADRPCPPAAEALAAVAERGGVAIAAHPYSRRDAGFLGDAIYETPGLLAVETTNGASDPREDRLAEEAAWDLGLPRVGGSDCRRLHEVGRCATLFERPVESVAQLIEEIRAGRCRPQRSTKGA